jgi:pimeloyl-ACP methyl ester carboxylesterase
MPAKLGAHELVLLHGQPGSAADWLQVAGRLPAQLHAVAADRPGYGSSQLRAGGFAANAQAVLDDLDSRGIKRAVLVGHSYGGGVALSAASLAPHQVEAVVVLASVGPGCVNRWDRLLAAPLVGPLCALVAWRLTPWIARARLAQIAGRSPAARARRRSSPAQARPGCRRRCHSGVPGSGGRSRQPRMRRAASPSGKVVSQQACPRRSRRRRPTIGEPAVKGLLRTEARHPGPLVTGGVNI